MSSIKLVTFDISKTLLRGRFPLGKQYAEALREFADIDSDPYRLSKSFNQVYELHEKAYPVFGTKDGLTLKTWWRSVFLGTLVTSKTIDPIFFGVSKLECAYNSLDLWQLEELSSPIEQVFEFLFENYEYEAIPHAHQLLNSLKHNFDVFLGAISNGDQRIVSKLESAGLRNYLDFVITSTDCGFEKPDKQIFEYALKIAQQKLSLDNCISPSAVIHIGDGLKEDYQGALDAGFKAAILIDTEDKFSDVVNSDYRAKHLQEVLLKLNSILT